MEHRSPVPRATSTRCRSGGKCPQHRPGPKTHRPIRDLPVIESTVKYAESAHHPKASEVTAIVGSGSVWTCSSGVIRLCKDHEVCVPRAAAGGREGNEFQLGRQPELTHTAYIADRSSHAASGALCCFSTRTASTTEAILLWAAWRRWLILLDEQPEDTARLASQLQGLTPTDRLTGETPPRESRAEADRRTETDGNVHGTTRQNVILRRAVGSSDVKRQAYEPGAALRRTPWYCTARRLRENGSATVEVASYRLLSPW